MRAHPAQAHHTRLPDALGDRGRPTISWRVGDLVTEAVQRKSLQFALAFLIFCVFAGVEFTVEWLIEYLPLAAHGLINGMIVGGFAGFTGWVLLQAARRRRERLSRELAESARLNHEIRNALEVINHAGYLVNDVVYGRAVAESIERIKKSLDESRLG